MKRETYRKLMREIRAAIKEYTEAVKYDSLENFEDYPINREAVLRDMAIFFSDAAAMALLEKYGKGSDELRMFSDDLRDQVA